MAGSAALAALHEQSIGLPDAVTAADIDWPPTAAYGGDIDWPPLPPQG
ncbi:MAG TPA: hypothetical protein VE546_08735 [Streptomyces sp.]|nr:hypothetical protein [Streptomyces sp.]